MQRLDLEHLFSRAPQWREVLTELVALRQRWQAAALHAADSASQAEARAAEAASAFAQLRMAATRAGLLLADEFAARPAEADTEGSTRSVRPSQPQPEAEPESEPKPESEPETEGIWAEWRTPEVAKGSPHRPPQPGPALEPVPESEPAPLQEAELEPLAATAVVRTAAPEPLPAEGLQPAKAPLDLSATTLAELQRAMSGDTGPIRSQRIAPSRGAAPFQGQAVLAAFGGVPAQLRGRGDFRNLLKLTEAGLKTSDRWSELDSETRQLLVASCVARIRAVLEAVRTGDVDGNPDRDAESRCEVALWRLESLRASLALPPLPTQTQTADGWLRVAHASQDRLRVLQQKQHFNADDAFRRLRECVVTASPRQLEGRVGAMLSCGVAVDDKRFIALFAGREAEFDAHPQLAKVCAAVKNALREANDAGCASSAPPWPHVALTRGKRAVIVGGDGRQGRLSQLQALFQFAELDWPDVPKNAPGKVRALVKQVKKRKWDLVICLQQFISHGVTDELFALKVPGVTMVLAEGYGCGQLQRGLERYLLPRGREAEG